MVNLAVEVCSSVNKRKIINLLGKNETSYLAIIEQENRNYQSGEVTIMQKRCTRQKVDFLCDEYRL